MNSDTKIKILNLISTIFIFLFVYTAFSKFFEMELFRFTLSKSPLIGSYAPVVAVALPAIELVTGGLFFLRATKKIAAYITLLLMAIFTLYTLYMILFTPHLPCSCGGVIKWLSWPQHLALNIILTILAFIQVHFVEMIGGDRPTVNYSLEEI